MELNVFFSECGERCGKFRIPANKTAVEVYEAKEALDFSNGSRCLLFRDVADFYSVYRDSVGCNDKAKIFY